MGINIGQLKDKKAVEKELKRIQDEENKTLDLIKEVESKAFDEDETSTGVLSEWCGKLFNYVTRKSKINGK